MVGVEDGVELLFVLEKVELWLVAPLQALSKKKQKNRPLSAALCIVCRNERGLRL